MRPRCKCGGFLTLQNERNGESPIDYLLCHACARRIYRTPNMPKKQTAAKPVPVIRGY